MSSTNKQSHGISVLARSALLNFTLPLLVMVGFFSFLLTAQYSQLYQDAVDMQNLAANDLAARLSARMATNFRLLDIAARSPGVIQALKDLPADSVAEADVMANESAGNVRKILLALFDPKAFDFIYFGSTTSPALLAQADADVPAGYDARTRPWYGGALKQHESTPDAPWYLTEPYVTASQAGKSNLAVTCSRVVLDDAGEVCGVVAIDFNLEGFTSIIAGTQKSLDLDASALLTDSSQARIWSDTGGFVSGAEPKDQAVAMIAGMDIPQDLAKELAARVFKEPSVYFEGTNHGFDKEGKPRVWTAMARSIEVPGTGWVILTYREKEQILLELLPRTVPPVLLSLAGFVLFTMLGNILFFRSAILPLRRLRDTLKDLGSGDGNLQARLDTSRKGGEITEISFHFNVFVEKISRMVHQIQQATEVISTQKDDLVSVTEESASAAHEITTNVASIDKQISALNSEIRGVSSSMEEISQAVQSLGNATDTQGNAVQTSISSVEQMVAQLKNVAKIADQKKRSAEQLTETIQKSGEAVEQSVRVNLEVTELTSRISEMSSTIKGIASQTNLLSMNAAIEAAHAGESGKGFAVVADEIRKLAEIAQTSSAEISTTVQEIEAKVKVADQVAGNSAATFRILREDTRSTIQALEEIDAATRELSQGGELILKASAELEHVSESVRQSSEEMNRAVMKVGSSVQQVAGISQQVASGMAEIAVGIQEVAEASQVIQKVSLQVADGTRDLKAETARFKI